MQVYSHLHMMNIMQPPVRTGLVQKSNGEFGQANIYNCTQRGCTQTFYEEDACRNHIALHNATQICVGCKRTFATKNLLTRHQQNCPALEVKFTCACGKTFQQKKSLELHQSTLGCCRDNPITCGCGVTYNKKGFANHASRSKCPFAKALNKELGQQENQMSSTEITELEENSSESSQYLGKETSQGNKSGKENMLCYV